MTSIGTAESATVRSVRRVPVTMIVALSSTASTPASCAAAGTAQPVVASAVVTARMERGCEVRMVSSLFLRSGPTLRSALGSAKATPIRPAALELLHFGGGCGNRATGATLVDGIMLRGPERSEEHTSELQSLMRISYAVFCL